MDIISSFLSNMHFAPTYGELLASNSDLERANRELVDELVETESAIIDHIIDARNASSDLAEAEELLDDYEAEVSALSAELESYKQSYTYTLCKLIEVAIENGISLSLDLNQ